MRLVATAYLLAALLIVVPSASALPASCVDPDLSSAPAQTQLEYDLAGCLPFPTVLDPKDPPETPKEVEAQTLVIGVPLGSGGICIILDAGLAGSLWTDLENDCDQDPCKVAADGVCDLLRATGNLAPTRAIGSSAGPGASL